MHPGPNTRKSTANQPWWQCGLHLVGTMWSIFYKKHMTWNFTKKTFSNKKKGPRSTSSLLLIFLKKKKQPATGFPKKIFFKKMWIVCFPKKLFPTIRKVPTRQQQHVRRLIAFFCKRKKTDLRLSKKILLQTKKCGLQLSKKSFSNKKKSPHPAQCHDSNSTFCCLISAYFLKEKRPTAWPTTWAFQKILLQTKQIVHESTWDRLSKKNLFPTKKSPPGTAPRQQQRILQVNYIFF